MKKKKSKVPGVVCTIIGVVILAAAIAVCLPMTLPRALGYQIYDVVSGSMEPTIPVGSLVLVEPFDAADLEEGDIVAYSAGAGETITVDSAADTGAASSSDTDSTDAGTAGENESSSSASGQFEVTGADGTQVILEDESRQTDTVITHRVVENHIVDGVLITKGDANTTADANPIEYSRVIGKVTKHFPMLGDLMKLFSSMIGKVYLLAFAVCGLLFLIVGGRLRRGAAAGREE